MSGTGSPASARCPTSSTSWSSASATAARPGCGSTSSARRDRAHGRGYYRRLHYLMCDYSPHVLELARATVAEHPERVSSFVLDATRPRTDARLPAVQGVPGLHLQRLRQPAHRRGRPARRPHLLRADPRAPAGRAAPRRSPRRCTPSRASCRAWSRKLLRLGPELLADAAPAHFPDLAAAVDFWRRVLGGAAARGALRAARRARHLRAGAGRQRRAAAPDAGVQRRRADARQQRRRWPASSTPCRCCTPRDAAVPRPVRDRHRRPYRTGFRGPGKYDGSVVNWVNGPLLAHVGRRRGFDVQFAPFAHRSGGNIVTMTAQVQGLMTGLPLLPPPSSAPTRCRSGWSG